MLEVSHEYASRLLRRGAFETGAQVDGCWRVDRLAVQACRDDRQEARIA